MNRQIKFRVWDKAKRVFIPDGVYGIIATDFGAFGVMLKDWGDYRQGEYFYENSQTLMQFTGLKDKNGEEIYEGDVLQHPRFYETPEMSYNPMETGVIIYKDGAFRFADGEGLLFEEMEGYDGDMEIIGNIYEKPELIK
jgi:uncharacterized phage protein (TIGR01671 family)